MEVRQNESCCLGFGLGNNNQLKGVIKMKTKLKYIIIASLLFGASGFNSAKAITADELLNTIVVPVYTAVIQAFTQIGQVLGDHDARISNLETEPGESSADNAPISVDCATQSLQAAIEAAPLHGKTVITISGDCSDDIYVRRNGITITGFTGPGTDSITGTASGFSSDPADNFNLPAAAGALVQRNLEAAIEINGRVRVRLENLTIDSGSNASAVKAERNSSLRLANVTLIGGPNGFGLYLHSSHARLTGTTISGDGTPSAVFAAGAAVFAEMNSVVDLKGGNTLTGGNGDTTGFVAFSNTSVELQGASNIFNAGLPGGPDDEPTSIHLVFNSTLYQSLPGLGNLINGGFDLSAGSRMALSSIEINSGGVELFDSSFLGLVPKNSGDIVFNTSIISLQLGSALEFGEFCLCPVDVNSGGVAGTMSLDSNSRAAIGGGSLINMDVQLFSGSSMEGDLNSKIGGNLEVRGFSTYEMTDQVGSSVLGTVTCFKGEAFDFTAAAPDSEISLGCL